MFNVLQIFGGIRRRLSLTEVLYFLAQIGPRILSFVTMLLLSHTLAPRDFGQISLMVTLGITSLAFATGWLATSAYRFAAGALSAGEVRDEIEILGLVPISWFFVGLVTTVTCLLFGLPAWLVLVAVAISLVDGFSAVASAISNAKQVPLGYLSIGLWRNVSTATMALLVYLLSLSSWAGPWVFAVGSSSVVFSSHFRQVLSGMRLRIPSWENTKRYLLFGIPSGLSFYYYILFHVGCRFIIAKYLGAADAGRFSLASDIFYAPTALVLGTFGLSLMPKMHGGWHEGGLEKARPWMNQYLTSQLLLTGPLVLGAFFLGDVFWKLVAPGGLMPGELWLPFLATVTGILLSLLACFVALLQVVDRPWEGLLFTFICIAVSDASLLVQGRGGSLQNYALTGAIAAFVGMLAAGFFVLKVSGVRPNWRMVKLSLFGTAGFVPLLYVMRLICIGVLH